MSCWTGRVITALEAEALGLVNRTTRTGQAMNIALSLAQGMAASSPKAIRGIKDVLRGYHTLEAAQARQRERDMFEHLWGSPDHRESVLAYLEKRQPVYKND